MNLYSMMVALLFAAAGLSAHATPLGHTRHGDLKSIDGNPAICLPYDTKQSFSVGRVALSESRAQQSGFWGVVLRSIANPLIMKPGDCFTYGYVPDGYELEGFGPKEHPLKFEKNKTYVFRITEASGSNDTYRVIFCIESKVDGVFRFWEYTQLPGGGELIPSCDARRNGNVGSD